MKPRTILISLLSLLLIHLVIAQQPGSQEPISPPAEAVVPEEAELGQPPVATQYADEPLADTPPVPPAPVYTGEEPTGTPGENQTPAATMGDQLLTERAETPVEDPGTASSGEESGAPATATAETDFSMLPPIEPEQPVIQESGAKISVDFPDEDIKTILRIVADLYDLNLVIPEALMGRASIKLRNVTWQQVYDVVLSPVGYTYVDEANIIKIVSLESLNLEPPVTEVVILNYAAAEEIQKTINPMVGGTGRIQVDKRSNALVITEAPTRMRRIRSIIESLDQPTMQVMIESKFVETQNRAVKNIGVNWTSLDGYQASAGPFSHSYERERGNTNTRNRQSTSGTSTQTTTGSPTSSTVTSGTQNSNTDLDLDATTKLTTAVFSAEQFNVVLSALQTTDDVKLVSNPTVVTLNNTKANIHIGQEYPVVTPRYNPETGTYEAGGSPEITQIGISLEVTPQVNSAGFINLDVEPEVSTLGDTVTYFGAEYPIKITRRAHTYVTVRDGYTVAIGGLVQDDTVNVETKVPVLGSIPGLGRLFRSDSKDNDKRNLIIFLTARTLNPDGTSYEEILDPRLVREMGLTREEIPGYRSEIEMFPSDQPKEKGAAKEKTETEAPAVEAKVEPAIESPAESATGTVSESAPLPATEEPVAADAPVTGEAEVPAELEAPVIEVPATEAPAEQPASEQPASETVVSPANEVPAVEQDAPVSSADEVPATDSDVQTDSQVEPEPQSAPEQRPSRWLTPNF